jgi:hypothetical protein
MSKKIIAEIRLANGEVGYYDDYSRIHLTISKPSAVVYAGTNCSQIKKSIKSGRLRLVSGSFEAPVQEEVVQVVPAVVETKEEKVVEPEKEAEKEPEAKDEEVVAPTIEEVQEKVVNAVIEEITEEAATESVEKVVEAEVQEDGLQEEKTNKKKKKMR